MQSSLRRWAPAIGVLAGLFIATSTASASVPGSVRADSPAGASTSQATRTAIAKCPAGKQVTGVGGELIGALGEASMTSLKPDPSLTQVTVRAEELGAGSTRNWRLTAYAMCANPIPGSHLVTGRRFSDIFTEASARATCPAGEKLLGAGGEIRQATSGRVVLTGMQFNASNIVDVRGQETPAGDSSNWSVDALGICAPPLPGQIRGANFSSVDSAASKSRGIGCPAGTNLTGGAGFTVGGGEVVLDDLIPTPTGFTALGREDANGFAGNWILEAHAICA